MASIFMKKTSARWILCTLLLLSSAVGEGYCEPTDMPTKKDTFFWQAAINFEDPAFCEKIIPSNDNLLSFRSDCYQQLAINTRRPDLCRKVVPVPVRSAALWAMGWQLPGTQNTESNCRESVEKRMCPSYGLRSLVNEDGMALLEQAGYTPDKLPKFDDKIQDRIAQNNRDDIIIARQKVVIGIYNAARAKPAFISKVKRLSLPHLDTSGNDFHLASGEERFTYFIGADNNLPEVCERISPHTYAEEKYIQRIDRILRVFFLRNVCFHYVALHLHDPNICDKIQPVPRNSPDDSTHVNSDTMRADECKREIERDPSGNTDTPVNLISEDLNLGIAVLEEMLPRLGEKIPAAPPPERPAAIPLVQQYSGFYNYILHDAPAAEREEFKRRIMNLN